MLHLFFKLVSSVLVVAFSENVANALECKQSADGMMLLFDSEVPCYQEYHVWLLAHLLPIFVLFSIVVIPYVVVQGESHYVQTEEIFSTRWWYSNAERQATSVHLGPLHPVGKNVFANALTEYFLKLSLPLFGYVFHSPLQLTLACALATTSWLVVTLAREPFVEQSFLQLILGLRLVAVVVNWCAVLVVLTGRPHLCMALLLSGSVTITLCTVHRAKNLPFLLDTDKGRVRRFGSKDFVRASVL
jgi:hypothetical protein